jgi:hypothetical protein
MQPYFILGANYVARRVRGFFSRKAFDAGCGIANAAEFD